MKATTKRILLSVLVIGALLLSFAGCSRIDKVNNVNGAEESTTISLEDASVAARAATGSAGSTTGTTGVGATTTTAATTGATVSLTGSWQDKVSERATMTVTAKGNNQYTLKVHWSSAFNEAAEWTMSGTYDPSTGTLSYKDCHRVVVIYDDDGTSSNTEVYTGGSGTFTYSGGQLSWHADNDSDVNSCVFVRG